MPYTDPANLGLFDDVMFPFIDNDFDWDAFFNFEPEANDPSFPRQEVSLTQWEPLGSAPQGQRPSGPRLPLQLAPVLPGLLLPKPIRRPW